MDIKPAKERNRVKQLIIQELVEISALWGDISIAQHLVTIMRPYSNAYDWTDDMLMKKVEKYRDELENQDIDVTRED